MAVVAQERRTHKERRAASDKRIIQAAIDLFASGGYQRTTLIQIGQRADCTGTLISNRYGSKEGLLRAVLAHILNRLETGDGPARPQITPDTDRPAPEILSAFVDAYFDDITQAESRVRALYVIMGEALGALPEIHDDIVKVNLLFRAAISQIVTYGIGRGEFDKSCEPEVLATLIVGILRGVTQQVLTEPDTQEVTALRAPTKAAVAAICSST